MVRPVYWVAGVVAVLALLILPDLQRWHVQRGRIDAAQEQAAQSQRDLATLQAEQNRWRDPEYVEAQARERLHFVMPGETGFVVLDPPAGPDVAGDPGRAAAVAASGGTRPWFGDLWESVQVAGE